MDGERRVAEPVRRNRFFRPDCASKYRIAARSFAVLFLGSAIVRGIVLGGHLDYPGSPWLKMPGQLAGMFGLAATDIELTGLHHHDSREILDHIDVRPGGPLIGFDAKKAKSRLEELDWIDSATVVRRFPNQLQISVVEREPFVVWQYKGVLHVVDQKGKPMSGAVSGINMKLHVVGEGANTAALELVNQMEATPALMLEVQAAIRMGDRRWDLKMKNGVVVALPEMDVESALKDAEIAFFSPVVQQNTVSKIDFRFAGEVGYLAATQPPLVGVDATTTSSIQ
jgi:cell division protein FtsQ